MKNIFSILVLIMLLNSCSSDDNKDLENSTEEEVEYCDAEKSVKCDSDSNEYNDDYNSINKEDNLNDKSIGLDSGKVDEDFSQTNEPKKGDVVVNIKTNMGDIKILMFPQYAPKTVENFVTHAKNKYYDGIIFHRVIEDFMIQGGDPTGTGMGGESIWGKGFEDEPNINLSNIRGSLAMANAGQNTNGSQFFINQKKSGNPYLDGYENGKLKDCSSRFVSCHTVFGQVYEGMDIVDKIAETKVDDKDKPIEAVIIDTIEVSEF